MDEKRKENGGKENNYEVIMTNPGMRHSLQRLEESPDGRGRGESRFQP